MVNIRYFRHSELVTGGPLPYRKTQVLLKELPEAITY